jgi:hypothetical protein
MPARAASASAQMSGYVVQSSPAMAGMHPRPGCHRSDAVIAAGLHSGLNPIASSAGAISGFDMNSFQTSPDR